MMGLWYLNHWLYGSSRQAAMGRWTPLGGVAVAVLVAWGGKTCNFVVDAQRCQRCADFIKWNQNYVASMIPMQACMFLLRTHEGCPALFAFHTCMCTWLHTRMDAYIRHTDIQRHRHTDIHALTVMAKPFCLRNMAYFWVHLFNLCIFLQAYLDVHPQLASGYYSWL